MGAVPDDPELRTGFAAAREEWRAQEEQAGRDAWDAHVHGRMLDDVLRAAMARGDLLRVAVGGHTVEGTVVELDDDLLALRRPDGLRVDVHRNTLIPLAFRVVSPAAAPGITGTDVQAAGWRSRILALEAGGGECVVAVVGEADLLVGVVQAGRDHLVLRDAFGRETFVAFGALVFVSPRPG